MKMTQSAGCSLSALIPEMSLHKALDPLQQIRRRVSIRTQIARKKKAQTYSSAFQRRNRCPLTLQSANVTSPEPLRPAQNQASARFFRINRRLNFLKRNSLSQHENNFETPFLNLKLLAFAVDSVLWSGVVSEPLIQIVDLE